MSKKKQHCPKGHDTFLVGRTSQSVCRECERIRHRQRHANMSEEQKQKKKLRDKRYKSKETTKEKIRIYMRIWREKRDEQQIQKAKEIRRRAYEREQSDPIRKMKKQTKDRIYWHERKLSK